MSLGDRPAHALHQRKITILHLNRWRSFPTKLPNGFDDLGHSAAVRRMIVTESAAVGVERKPPDARDEIPVGNKAPALPSLAESKIFELNQNGDGETVATGTMNRPSPWCRYGAH